MRKFKLLALALVATLGVTSFVGCGTNDKDNKKVEKKDEKKDNKKDEKKDEKKDDKKDDKPAPAPSEAKAGFEELPIGEQKEVGPYIVSPVYFQPVDMYPKITAGVEREDAACHLEADIHFLPKKSVAFGFGEAAENEDGELEGAWPAYLTVNYKILDKDGKTVDEGVFMPMNASDGPHYGANIKKTALPGAGKYKLHLSIVPPKEYLLHVDQETGVEGAKDGSKEYQEFYKTYDCDFDWDFNPTW